MEKEEKKKSPLEQIKEQQADLFSEINAYLLNDNITDVEWDGYQLWLTELGKGCYPVEDKLSNEFINNLSIRLANIMGVPFNPIHPVLEAHTEELRISILHESRCGVKSLAVRKVPIVLRYTHEKVVETKMMPEELLNLLENCLIAHCNVVIGGRPHAGKTELLKYLSGYIPPNEKVLSLEDNAEIHYRQIHPNRKSVSFLVDNKITYSDAIKACLRHNADWLLLSEARGPEVLELLNALSTGSYCMTTIHVDGARDIPDRMYNMLGESADNPRFINNIYRYIDVGLIIKADKKENRFITELGFFDRKPVMTVEEDGSEHIEIKNIYVPFYSHIDGMKDKSALPDNMLRAFSKVGITDPFARPEVPKEFVETA